MQYYYLEVVKGVEKGRRYPINDGANSIGRSSSNTITLHPEEKAVSGHHAILYKSPENILIQDIQSTNGTYINDTKAQERQITPSDTIGFGQMGPRLRIIVSGVELSTDAIDAGTATTSYPDTGDCTIDDENHTDKLPPTHSTLDAIPVISQELPKKPVSLVPENASMTVDIENRLIQNKLDTTDMQSLLQNGKRIEKILDRGNLHEAQSSLLASAYSAGKRTRKIWIIIISVISALSLIIIVFLGGRLLHYRHMLHKGLSLENKLDVFEDKIFQAHKNPQVAQKDIAAMIEELEKTKAELAAVKKNIHNDDQEKFYLDETEKMIDEIMVRFGETDYHIPPMMVERVKYHLGIFSGRMKSTITKYLRRKQKYFPMIIETFKQNNLPPDLAYISMLESGFNPTIISHAGARGLWQFMPKTGRSYGLKVNNNIDERCNPEKATRAAAEYFKDLISIFGGKSSVMLAMAAYNAGEYRISGALKRIEDPIRNRDFWYIYRMGHLAEETNEYIPKVLALMIIDKHRDKYGFEPDQSL